MNVDRRTFLLGAAATSSPVRRRQERPPARNAGARPGAQDGRDRLRLLLRADRGRQAARRRCGRRRSARTSRSATIPSGTAAQVEQLRPGPVTAAGSTSSRWRRSSRGGGADRGGRAQARDRDVSYVTPLKHQSAGIVVDRGEAGRIARGRRGQARQARARRPAAVGARGAAPVRSRFANAEKAIGGVVGSPRPSRRRPMPMRGVVGGALKSDGSIELVLCWQRPDAIGAAAAVGSRDVYVGGLGAPSSSDRACAVPGRVRRSSPPGSPTSRTRSWTSRSPTRRARSRARGRCR